MNAVVVKKPSKRRVWLTGGAIAVGMAAVYGGYATFEQWSQFALTLIGALFGAGAM